MTRSSAAAAPLRSVLRLVSTGLLLTLGAAVVAMVALAAPAQASTAKTVVGLLGPVGNQADSLTGSAVTRVSLNAGWDVLEPQQNGYNTQALNSLKTRLTDLRQQGFQVVLDLGMQYTPSWVFDLPGQTRFVNQYGDAWHAGLSEDVPNAVFNTNVRNAQAGYIAKVAAVLGAKNFASVRVGGLLSGELRFPPNTYNGHSDLMWDYDAAAQAGAPVPGWKPGAGDAAAIQQSLDYYFDSLTGYLTWQMRTIRSAFPGVDQQVMLPGWGVRPGMISDAVSTGMTNQSLAEVNGMIAAGSDWAGQVQAMKSVGGPATVYTTWLDAPQYGDSAQYEAPVAYLATLAAQNGLPLAGENTGGGGTDALALCAQRAAKYGMSVVMYMSGDLIDRSAAGVTLGDVTKAAADIRA